MQQELWLTVALVMASGTVSDWPVAVEAGTLDGEARADG